MTQISLTANKKNNIDLVIAPKKDGTQITEAVIADLIEKSPYQGLYLDSGNIKNAIAELNSVLKPLQANQTGRQITYQILERRDATITVTVASGDMSATAEISTALGGKHLTAKAILKAAQQVGVVKGFSKEQLVKLALKAAKELPGAIVSGEIAQGKDPINGVDSKIKPLVESAQSRILKPKKRDDGSVDMRDLGDIICVKIGDNLAKKIPLTEGKAGFTVKGVVLQPKPGGDVQLKAGEGTSISPTDELILVSDLVGIPRVIDNGMEVDGVYRIKNVDISTGHIKFQGSVIIDGDVSEGMMVYATGDITIGGFVESATLEAGGDITIGTGIIGRKYEVEDASFDDINLSAIIRAKGDVFAKYCQYAEISCNTLRIEKQMMHCLIDVVDVLWLGSNDRANGKLIGGYIKGGSSVHAGIIGATAGSSTIINFDKKINLIKQQLDELDEKLTAESDKTNELRGATNKLRKLPKSPENQAMLEKIHSTYMFHNDRLAQFLSEKEAIEVKLQQYMCSVFIEATEKLYHGVQLIVGDFQEKSRREYGPSKMLYSERKVHIEPLVHT